MLINGNMTRATANRNMENSCGGEDTIRNATNRIVSTSRIIATHQTKIPIVNLKPRFLCE